VESSLKEPAKNVKLVYLWGGPLEPWGLMPQGLCGPYLRHWMVQRKVLLANIFSCPSSTVLALLYWTVLC